MNTALTAGPEAQLKRLMVFRVVTVTTLLLIAAYVEAISEALRPVNPLYIIIAGTYVLTVAYALTLRHGATGAVHSWIQLLGDIVTVTALVYVTGVSGMGFILLYPLVALAGSVVLPGRGGWAVAFLATGAYALLLMAVRRPWLPPAALADVVFMPARAVWLSVIVTGTACFSVALVGAYLSEGLRQAGRQLRAAAEEMADLRGLNQVIVDSLQSGLITTDDQGRVIWANRVGLGVLQRTITDIHGTPVGDLLGLPELDTLGLGSGGRSRLEGSHETPDGLRIPLGVSVAPLAGELSHRGSLIVFQDLTEIKQLEEEVRTKDRLAAVGEMTAQLAHEIRNPLGAISGSAQVLMAAGEMGGDERQLLSIITRESKRLSDTLNRFLFQVRTPSPILRPIDLRPVVEESLALLRNGDEVRPNQTIDFRVDAGPHLCLGDPDQLEQVLWNLARNGLEAMPDGGRLDVHLERSDRDLVLSVRDEGQGLVPDWTGERAVAGAACRIGGLGLAIVYRIVREHRGDIRIRSAKGTGTVVQVRLPSIAAEGSA